MALKNYYFILGISRKASHERIRAAFRNLAKKYHPDRVGTEENVNQFRDISEAYEVLSDPEKRKGYNRKLKEEEKRQRGNCPKKPGMESQSDKASEFFDSAEFVKRRNENFRSDNSPFARDFFSRIYRERQFSNMRRQKVSEFDAYLSPDEAAHGVKTTVDLPMESLCPRCLGAGRELIFVCPVCRGRGGIRMKIRCIIEIPPGVRNGRRIRIPVEIGEEKDLHLILHVHIIS